MAIGQWKHTKGEAWFSTVKIHHVMLIALTDIGSLGHPDEDS